jgi:hypothetical protein
VDGDPRVILLYYDLGEYGMSSFDGFFRAQDEGSCAHCNHAEMLFLDAARNDPSADYMLSIIPHEMTHMVLFVEDPNEESWIGETLAETAMIACGWFTDVAAVEQFTRHPDTPLIELEHPDYGAAFLFGLYLYERYGAALVKGLAAEPANGVAGFDAVFPDDLADVLPRWFVANLADDAAPAGGAYGYASFDVPNVATTFGETDDTPRGGSVDGSAADYLYFTTVGPGTLRLTLAAAAWQKLGAAALTSPEPEEAGNLAVTPLALTGAETSFDVAVPSGHERTVVAVFSAQPPESSPFAYTWRATFE